MNRIETLLSKNIVKYWNIDEMKQDLAKLLHLISNYCTIMRIPIYRFPSLSYLNKEISNFCQKFNCDNEEFSEWFIDELFMGSPTLLEKVLELEVQYPDYIPVKFRLKLKQYRERTIKGRIEDNVYIVEIDIVGSGKLTNEERALYGKIDYDQYYSGVHAITGGFTLIKEKIKDANGYIISEQGDAFLAAFEDVEDAVYAAYILQTELRRINNLEYRIGIGRGNLCVMHRTTRYCFSIVEAVRIASIIRNAGVLMSQNCFCKLINCRNINVCPDEKIEILNSPEISESIRREKLSECSKLNDPNLKWPWNVKLRKYDIKIKIMPRGLIQLKHTTQHAFEILIGDKPWVIL